MVSLKHREVIMNKELEKFYDENQEELETLWEEHLSYGEWGSGLDSIRITEDMFWEFVEEQMEKN